jgi:hypothetical protein
MEASSGQQNWCHRISRSLSLIPSLIRKLHSHTAKAAMKVKINKTPFILNLLILTFSIPTIKKQEINKPTQTHYPKTNDINKSIKK